MRKGGDGREIDLGISDMKGVLVPSAMNFDSFEVSSECGIHIGAQGGNSIG